MFPFFAHHHPIVTILIFFFQRKIKIEKDAGKITIITYTILLIPGTTLLAIKNGDGFSQRFNNKSDIIINVRHVPPCVLSILCGLPH